MMRFSFLFRCRVNRRTGSREGVIGGRPTRIPWSWTPPALASSRAPHRRAPELPVFGRCCGDAWLVTVQTDAGGARSEGSSASVGRTTHHTSSYIGSWASPGEFRALSGSSETSVGDVPDRSRVRPAFFDHFRCARCHFSPPTGAGHVLKVSRTWPFPAIQKVCGPGWRAPVDTEETPVGYGIVQP